MDAGFFRLNEYELSQIRRDIRRLLLVELFNLKLGVQKGILARQQNEFITGSMSHRDAQAFETYCCYMITIAKRT